MSTQQVPSPETLYDPGFRKGFGYAVSGIWLWLRRPKLLLYTITSVAINAVLLGIALWWLWGLSDQALPVLEQWVRSNIGFLGQWLGGQGLHYTLMALKWSLLLLFLYFVVPALLVSMLHINPISSWLATRCFRLVFQEKTGQPLIEVDGLVSETLKMILSELSKLLTMMCWLFLALCLNIIPFLGTILSTIMLLWVNARYTGWSFVTPYYEGLGYGYSKQRKAMRAQRGAILGLGVIAAIPIVNILAPIFGMIGGALLIAEAHQKADVESQQ